MNPTSAGATGPPELLTQKAPAEATLSSVVAEPCSTEEAGSPLPSISELKGPPGR